MGESADVDDSDGTQRSDSEESESSMIGLASTDDVPAEVPPFLAAAAAAEQPSNTGSVIDLTAEFEQPEVADKRLSVSVDGTPPPFATERSAESTLAMVDEAAAPEEAAAEPITSTITSTPPPPIYAATPSSSTPSAVSSPALAPTNTDTLDRAVSELEAHIEK